MDSDGIYYIGNQSTKRRRKKWVVDKRRVNIEFNGADVIDFEWTNGEIRDVYVMLISMHLYDPVLLFLKRVCFPFHFKQQPQCASYYNHQRPPLLVYYTVCL